MSNPNWGRSFRKKLAACSVVGALVLGAAAFTLVGANTANAEDGTTLDPTSGEVITLGTDQSANPTAEDIAAVEELQRKQEEADKAAKIQAEADAKAKADADAAATAAAAQPTTDAAAPAADTTTDASADATDTSTTDASATEEPETTATIENDPVVVDPGATTTTTTPAPPACVADAVFTDVGWATKGNAGGGYIEISSPTAKPGDVTCDTLSVAGVSWLFDRTNALFDGLWPQNKDKVNSFAFNTIGKHYYSTPKVKDCGQIDAYASFKGAPSVPSVLNKADDPSEPLFVYEAIRERKGQMPSSSEVYNYAAFNSGNCGKITPPAPEPTPTPTPTPETPKCIADAVFTDVGWTVKNNTGGGYIDITSPTGKEGDVTCDTLFVTGTSWLFDITNVKFDGTWPQNRDKMIPFQFNTIGKHYYFTPKVKDCGQIDAYAKFGSAPTVPLVLTKADDPKEPLFVYEAIRERKGQMPSASEVYNYAKFDSGKCKPEPKPEPSPTPSTTPSPTPTPSDSTPPTHTISKPSSPAPPASLAFTGGTLDLGLLGSLGALLVFFGIVVVRLVRKKEELVTDQS